jgi:hypothetical protein
MSGGADDPLWGVAVIATARARDIPIFERRATIFLIAAAIPCPFATVSNRQRELLSVSINRVAEFGRRPDPLSAHAAPNCAFAYLFQLNASCSVAGPEIAATIRPRSNRP